MSQTTPSLHILIACGGTGGHLFPGIAVAVALFARGHKARLLVSRKKVDANASAKYAHLDFQMLPAVAKPQRYRRTNVLTSRWCSMLTPLFPFLKRASEGILTKGAKANSWHHPARMPAAPHRCIYSSPEVSKRSINRSGAGLSTGHR